MSTNLCLERKFGPYLVKALKRHVNSNLGNVDSMQCHEVYSLLYNVLFDFHLNSEGKKMLNAMNNIPPMCMRTGSLLHCLKWAKWRNDNLRSP